MQAVSNGAAGNAAAKFTELGWTSADISLAIARGTSSGSGFIGQHAAARTFDVRTRAWQPLRGMSIMVLIYIAARNEL
jgi:hypothetical protein